MKKNYTPEYFTDQMNILFPSVGNFLNGETDFQFLVAILLSAQMTDKGVNKATEDFFKVMKTPQDAFNMGQEKIYGFVKSVNFAPTKAKNIFLTAKKLQEEYNGVIPKNRKQLVTLPGVGNKTAGVFLLQQGYDFAFPVDTHIARISQCFGFTQKTNADEIERDLKQKFTQKELWNLLHKQMILYGRNYLTARKKPETVTQAWKDLEKNIDEFLQKS